MKRLISIFSIAILLFLPITLHAQNGTPVPTDSAWGAQANAVINNLATKLSVPAAKLYSVLVKQSYTEGVMDLVTAGALILVLIFSLSIVKQGYSLWQVSEVDERTGSRTNYVSYNLKDAAGWRFWVGTIASLILFLFVMGYLRAGLGEVLNPDYYALRFIVDALKSATR